MDVHIPAIGNYIFKCVVDENNAISKEMPFQIAQFRYETCRPTVKVRLVPDGVDLRQTHLNYTCWSRYKVDLRPKFFIPTGSDFWFYGVHHCVTGK